MQINPMRLHPRHSGLASEHLTLRRLQLKQPRFDLWNPLPGTGFLFLLGACFSASDVSFSSVLDGVVIASLSVETEGCLRGVKNIESVLLPSELGDALYRAIFRIVPMNGWYVNVLHELCFLRE